MSGTTVFVTAAGQTVEATYRHPFWVVRGEALAERPRLDHLAEVPEGATTAGRWVDAADLRIGDELLLRDGRVVAVEALRHTPFEGTVYNLAVEELACYAVGRNGVLVHNTNGAEGAAAPKNANPIQGLPRTGSALKTDPYHAFPNVIDNFASNATATQLRSGATLYQVEGSLNGVAGRFEWIVDGGNVTHRMFVRGDTLNGVPIKP